MKNSIDLQYKNTAIFAPDALGKKQSWSSLRMALKSLPKIQSFANFDGTLSLLKLR